MFLLESEHIQRFRILNRAVQRFWLNYFIFKIATAKTNINVGAHVYSSTEEGGSSAIYSCKIDVKESNGTLWLHVFYLT